MNSALPIAACLWSPTENMLLVRNHYTLGRKTGPSSPLGPSSSSESLTMWEEVEKSQTLGQIAEKPI